jgi:hypothetical protein
LTGFWDAGDVTGSHSFRVEDASWDAEPAEIHNIVAAGWAPLIKDSAP